jgi:NTP pyrophosphatase (non-canonical NTP hydrolase)
MEECGELTQACSKVLRHGTAQDRINLLIEEAGDVLCMLKLLEDWGYFEWKDLKKRVKFKKTKLKRWSKLVK